MVSLWRSAYFWPRLCSTACIGVGSSMTGSYFLIFQIYLLEAKPRIHTSGVVFFHSLRWLRVLISVLHQGKGLGSFAKFSEFLICRKRCCFTIVTCNWMLQTFASIDWASSLVAPGGFLCFRSCWGFMIVTCDWMLQSFASIDWARCLVAPGGFLCFRTYRGFMIVTCDWMLQRFASIDWSRCLVAPGGFSCFSTRCGFMIVTCDWMLQNFAFWGFG